MSNQNWFDEKEFRALIEKHDEKDELYPTQGIHEVPLVAMDQRPVNASNQGIQQGHGLPPPQISNQGSGYVQNQRPACSWNYAMIHQAPGPLPGHVNHQGLGLYPNHLMHGVPVLATDQGAAYVPNHGNLQEPGLYPGQVNYERSGYQPHQVIDPRLGYAPSPVNNQGPMQMAQNLWQPGTALAAFPHAHSEVQPTPGEADGASQTRKRKTEDSKPKKEGVLHCQDKRREFELDSALLNVIMYRKVLALGGTITDKEWEDFGPSFPRTIEGLEARLSYLRGLKLKRDENRAAPATPAENNNDNHAAEDEGPGTKRKCTPGGSNHDLNQ